jgi:hypothetical protein
MSASLRIDAFNDSLDIWIKALEHYSFDELCARPSPQSWSVGQVYMHLLDDSQFYLGQMKSCVAGNDHADEEATSTGKTMLSNNDFTDERLEGDPSNAFMPQPQSKEQLMNELLRLKSEMNLMAHMISKGTFKGKSKHPGLGFFSAYEWLQFADMHFRHHLRQKKRIDAYLETRGEKEMK